MVGLQTGPIFRSIGNGSFLHSFFSTIAYNLENNKWGNRFPYLMKKLYGGELDYKECGYLEKELKIIQIELEEYDPSMIVWDIDDLSKNPPWGDNIADRITSLANYFYTDDGQDIFKVFYKTIDDSRALEKKILIRSL